MLTDDTMYCVYLCQVQVILLHVHKMVPDQKLHCLYVVFVLITAFNQTPVNTNPASKLDSRIMYYRISHLWSHLM